MVDGVMGVEAILLGETAFELNTFLLRAIYVIAMGAAVGFLAENEKRRRLEARDISLVLGARGGRRKAQRHGEPGPDVGQARLRRQ